MPDDILTREDFAVAISWLSPPQWESVRAHDAALRAALDAATRALRRLDEFLADAPDAMRDLAHAKGTLAHARGIAAAAIAEIEGK